jgi:hypothetical protein
MKKEEIYVVIDSEEKRLRAIQILTDAGENIWNNTDLIGNGTTVLTQTYITPIILVFYKGWYCIKTVGNKQEISLDQLEQLLSPQFVVKEIALPFEELQKQAELHGWKLVKEERQIKVGDFGKFSSENKIYTNFGFLKSIERGYFIEQTEDNCISSWSNFRHLTDEEKANIQQNW